MTHQIESDGTDLTAAQDLPLDEVDGIDECRCLYTIWDMQVGPKMTLVLTRGHDEEQIFTVISASGFEMHMQPETGGQEAELRWNADRYQYIATLRRVPHSAQYEMTHFTRRLIPRP